LKNKYWLLFKEFIREIIEIIAFRIDKKSPHLGEECGL